MVLTYITFGLYMVMMVGIGLYFYERTNLDVENFVLGGRKMGKWVTALSAQASDMSGWLLMGLPGAIYLSGMVEAWVAIGLFIGTFLNWVFVASRLRIYTEITKSLTISSFLSNRFDDRKNVLKTVSAIATLIFFTVYAASGLNGAGKLFESMFSIKFQYAVIIGSGVMIFYTMLGGFVAVCWTDLIQGWLMFFAIVFMPVLVYYHLEDGAIYTASIARTPEVSLSLFPEIGDTGIIGALILIISASSWGLGYFGQPHILSRFMSIKHIKLLPQTITIAMIWVAISLLGAVLIGLLSIPNFPDLVKPENEKVFILLIGKYCNPLISGVLFAAILAAIMSTIDSQLLVSSSTLVEDVCATFKRNNLSEQTKLKLNRIAVCLISIIATMMALNDNQTLFGLVKFAWGGLGATFGPAILAALYWRRANLLGIASGMLLSIITIILWNYYELNSMMYEIVPGFLINSIIIIIFGLACKPSENLLNSFMEFEKSFKKAKEEK